MLTAFRTFRNHAIMVDKSIIPPVCDQIRVKLRLLGIFFFFYFPNSLTCLEYFEILSYVEIPRKAGVVKTKARPTYFFPQDTEAPKLRFRVPQSQRSLLFTFTSCPHSTFWSDCSWDAQTAVPTSLHVLSSQNPPPSPPPQEFMCELR